MSEQPWNLPVAVTDIPETGRRFDVVADAHTRAALAKLAGVPGLPRLEAEFELTRFGDDGLRVVGRVVATVEQNCVLTLEPMENKVEEEFDLLFSPPRAASLAVDAVEAGQSDEPPETLRDGIVDLGAIATEFLILGIDPYPRKPGSVFNAPEAKENLESHPFAALAALKKSEGEQDK